MAPATAALAVPPVLLLSSMPVPPLLMTVIVYDPGTPRPQNGGARRERGPASPWFTARAPFLRSGGGQRSAVAINWSSSPWTSSPATSPVSSTTTRPLPSVNVTWIRASRVSSTRLCIADRIGA